LHKTSQMVTRYGELVFEINKNRSTPLAVTNDIVSKTRIFGPHYC